MNGARQTFIAVAWIALCCACGDTGRERVEIALAARGVAAQPVEAAGARITLTRADVAFGPAYFCASESARAELCEVALAELREAVVIRALDPAPQPLGTLQATTGEIRSALYDYGVSWLLTATQAAARPTAPEGHSAVLEGTVERGGQTLRFQAQVDVLPRARGDAAMNGQRTRHEILGAGEQLSVRVDPHWWIESMDVDALFALDTDGDGLVTLTPSTPPHDAILQGMTSRAPLRFEWSRE